MNEQSQFMNQGNSMVSQGGLFGQPPHAMMNQSQLMTASQASLSQPQMSMNQLQLIMAKSQMSNMPSMMGQSRAFNQKVPMVNRGYELWQLQQQQQQQQLQQLPVDLNMKFHISKPGFGNLKQQVRGNWKGKKPNDKRVDLRKAPSQGVNTVMTGNVVYKPPNLSELQYQNHLKARHFYPKKKVNNRFAPYAPRNTSSFIMRAKKSGGIASFVSPSPATPAVLPTPKFSPSTEVLGEMAKEEWGVDGYGSMKGLIRLRNDMDNREHEDDVEVVEDHEEDDDSGSSESDVEEEKNSILSRLDHETSRFEMVYPNHGLVDYNNILENRVDDQDTHIAQLEEENLTLKERLFLMERELGDLRMRLQLLERQNGGAGDVNDEVVGNVSENESDGGSDIHVMSKEEVFEYGDTNMLCANFENDSNFRREDSHVAADEHGRDVCMEELASNEATQEGGVPKYGEINVSVKQEEDTNYDQGQELDAAQVDGKKQKIHDGDAGTVHLEKSIGDGD